MENSEQSAFPVTPDNLETQNPLGGGLTKREYFAGLAMQGILANEQLREKLIADTKNDKNYGKIELDNCIAKEAILQADALLKKLESK